MKTQIEELVSVSFKTLNGDFRNRSRELIAARSSRRSYVESQDDDISISQAKPGSEKGSGSSAQPTSRHGSGENMRATSGTGKRDTRQSLECDSDVEDVSRKEKATQG